MNHPADSVAFESILRAIVPVIPQSADDDRVYVFSDAQAERDFQITRLEGPDGVRFFLQEHTPNGRLVKTTSNGDILRAWDDPRINAIEKEHGPNGMISECERAGIDVSSMVFCGAGFSVDSRYLDSLEACAQEIYKAIHSNARYNAYKELSDEEQAALGHQEKISSAAYWEHQKELAQNAMNSEKGLFKGCYVMSGSPISDEHKRLILAYLNKPEQQSWLQIRGLCVSGTYTLWQAWGAIDPAAPKMGDVGHPDPETLRQAIRSAVHSNLERIEDEIASHGSPRPRPV